MMISIFKNIIVNVSILVLVAYAMLRIKFIRDYLYLNQKKLSYKIILSIIFGLLGILSTYTGIPIKNSLANTRAISMIAGGLLGGPFVGIGAGIIAGVHRYTIDPGGFTSLACCISTIVEGIIGGYLHKYCIKSYHKPIFAFCSALFAEAVQMMIILVIASPFNSALELVKLISLPMILVNSFGVAIFIDIFDSVYEEQDLAEARRTTQILIIAEKCLPYFRKGLNNKENLKKAADIITFISGIKGIIITDLHSILTYSGVKILSNNFPSIAKETISSGKGKFSTENADLNFIVSNKSLSSISAPLIVQNEVVGCLIFFVDVYKRRNETDINFVKGLGSLFSTQLELSEVDYQKRLLQKAELNALQSQINPHFLFNSLNTITAFCREKPERARELIILLSDYFRESLDSGEYMISLQDELKYVMAYLELEKARFEEKLTIEIHIPQNINCTVPRLILQPIVENAVKHGIVKKSGKGRICILAMECENGTHIEISDTGNGMPDNIINKLNNDSIAKTKIGLSNVHKRLLSIYGKTSGLKISSTPGIGTKVIIDIPNDFGGDNLENCNC